MNVVTVTFETAGSIEEAVAWTAETVPCRALVISHSVGGLESTWAAVAVFHDECCEIGDLISIILSAKDKVRLVRN